MKNSRLGLKSSIGGKGRNFALLSLIFKFAVVLALVAAVILPASPAMASPDQRTIRPNAAGDYQEWETLVGTSHYGATSDQSDLTYIQTVDSSTKRDIQALQDPTFLDDSASITSVQIFFRAQATGTTASERLVILERQDTSERTSAVIDITRGSFNQYSGLANTVAPDLGGWTKAKLTALQAGVQVSRAQAGETLQVSEIWAVVVYTPPTWASYSGNYGSLGGTATDVFDTYPAENTVYMEGTGFTGSYQYKVIYWYYDAGWYKRYTDSGVVAASGGTLQNFYTFSPSDVAGNWQATVYYPSSYDPASYSATSDNLVADDISYSAQYSFYVDAAAVPEFSTVMAAIAVAGLCFGIYYWMRRRRLASYKVTGWKVSKLQGYRLGG